MRCTVACAVGQGELQTSGKLEPDEYNKTRSIQTALVKEHFKTCLIPDCSVERHPAAIAFNARLFPR